MTFNVIELILFLSVELSPAQATRASSPDNSPSASTSSTSAPTLLLAEPESKKRNKKNNKYIQAQTNVGCIDFAEDDGIWWGHRLRNGTWRQILFALEQTSKCGHLGIYYTHVCRHK